MKKITFLVLTILIGILLTACGGAATPGDTSVPTTEPTQSTEQTPPTEVPAATPSPEATASTIAESTTVPTATIETASTPIASATYVDDSNGLAMRLDAELLKNSTYRVPSGYDEDVTLVNGEFRREDAENALYVRLLEDNIAYGDVDGDGLEDALIVLVSNTGGSGNFVDLLAVSGAGGTPESIGATFLGDRVSVQSINVVNQQVVVNMITQGPNDPFCCPTLDVTVTYELQDGELKNVDYVENGTITPTPGGS